MMFGVQNPEEISRRKIINSRTPPHEFIIFWCEISSGYCTPKIIEIDSVFTKLSKNKNGDGRYLRHIVQGGPKK